MADLDVTLATIGAPVGKLALGAAEKSITATVSGRKLAILELIADDAAFLWNYVAGSTTLQGRVPAGGSLKVPVYTALTLYVTQDPSYAGVTIRASCGG